MAEAFNRNSRFWQRQNLWIKPCSGWSWVDRGIRMGFSYARWGACARGVEVYEGGMGVRGADSVTLCWSPYDLTSH